MARPRPTLRTVGVLGAAALLAAGCGGGDPAADAGTAAPGTDTTGQTVGDPGTGAVDGAAAPTTDTNGDGVIDANDAVTDPAAGGGDLGATATIPDLDGEAITGGLVSSGSTPVFDAKAMSAEDVAAADADKDDDDTSTDTAPKPVVRYTGAKISIDGVVHDVTRNGTFPKGSPAFRLLSVRGDSIEIELVAGEFTAGGGSGVLLDKGEEVSLVNASEQVTYRVTFLRPIQSDASILG
jgi:hypothetical protein